MSHEVFLDIGESVGNVAAAQVTVKQLLRQSQRSSYEIGRVPLLIFCPVSFGLTPVIRIKIPIQSNSPCYDSLVIIKAQLVRIADSVDF